MREAKFEIVTEECNQSRIVIRDVGPWDRFPSVTNDAEGVVFRLGQIGILKGGCRLLYYDSDGELDEIVLKDGVFAGFKPYTKD